MMRLERYPLRSDTPWTHTSERLIPACQRELARLKSLPRAQRRTLRRQWRMGLAGIALALALGGGLATVTPVLAGTIAVDGDGSTSTCSLADAIITANSGLDTGNCTGGSGGPDTINLYVDVGLTSPLPPITSTITIEGGSYTIERTGTTEFRILTVDGVSPEAGSLTLSQVTITGGKTTFGGGIFNSGGELTIRQSTISGNTARSSSGNSAGGGIYSKDGIVTIDQSTIADNYGFMDGGGIYNRGGTLVIKNDSLITGNDAEGSMYWFSGGGGITNIYGNLTLKDSTISANSAGMQGGGIRNDQGTLSIINSTLDQNWAWWGTGGIDSSQGQITIQNSAVSGNTGQWAGGISDSGTLTVQNCQFLNNQGEATTGSGAIKNTGTLTVQNSIFDGNHGGEGGSIKNDGNLTVTNSTFSGGEAHHGGAVTNTGAAALHRCTVSGNTVNWAGGGLKNAGQMHVSNSTISGNRSYLDGGGLWNQGTLTLVNSTITGNLAVDYGSGLYTTSGGTQTLANSIIALQTGGLDCDFRFTNGTIISADYNIESAGTCGLTQPNDQQSVSAAALLLSPLGDNGGPTQTHALQPGSVAIDKIADGVCAAAPISGTDQRGAARGFDGDGSGSTSECDIGAFEYRAPAEKCALTTGTDIPISGITFNLTSLGELYCIQVTDMGPVDHLAATGPGAGNMGLKTGRWWHVTGESDEGGDVTAGFDLAMTLPLTGADADSRVCRYPGLLGGFGWDCGDGSSTTFTANSVTRSGITSFSDFSAGDQVGPTASQVESLEARSGPASRLGVWFAAALALCASALTRFLRFRA